MPCSNQTDCNLPIMSERYAWYLHTFSPTICYVITLCYSRPAHIRPYKTQAFTHSRPLTGGALYCVRAFNLCLASERRAGACAGAAGRILALSAHHSTCRSNARGPNARVQCGQRCSSALGWEWCIIMVIGRKEQQIIMVKN